ncbi:MAG TPA: amidohydrolase family protein, partial [Solirubrobacterales bacterium]|nr:amidohydrolase family protein [Solirubrobacterales bacterium]
AYTPKRYPRELIDYMKTKSGRRKVLWGSNFPMIGPAAALEGIGELGLDEETTGLFLGGNARRVFGLPG